MAGHRVCPCGVNSNVTANQLLSSLFQFPSTAMASVADLKKAIIKCMKEADSWEDHLEQEIPSKWTLHGDCVLLPIKTFLDPVWVQCPLVFKEICKVLKVTKVARYV